MRESPWSQTTRDRWFFAVLALSTASVALLFAPYVYSLLFAGVTVVVTWPIYERVLSRVGGRRAIAAILTVAGLALLLFGPLGTIVYLFVLEAVEVAGAWIPAVKNANPQQLIGDWTAAGKQFIEDTPRLKQFVDTAIPKDFDPVATFLGPVKDGLLKLLNLAGDAIPLFIGAIGKAAFHGVIYLFAVISLYMEGPRVLDAMRNLSPLDDRYERRLFEVFREFATNMAVGSLATASVQGMVAGLGYLIAGVDGVLFFAIVTAVCSFVPIVGAMVVWVPLTISVAHTYGIGWAVFLAVWSIVFTGGVDNVLKPMFLRGSSGMHPLLIFLAVFGGMAWMGLPGALIGPVLVAFFLALYTIHKEDYLGNEDKAPQVEVRAEEAPQAQGPPATPQAEAPKGDAQASGASQPSSSPSPGPSGSSSGPASGGSEAPTAASSSSAPASTSPSSSSGAS